MRKHLILYLLLCCLPIVTRGQTPLDELDPSGLPQPTQAAALRYWFDDDAGSVQTTTKLSGPQTLDVSGLTEGLHTLHYQVTDNTGAVAFVRSALFLNVKSLTTPEAAAFRYWFDDDAGSLQTTTQLSGLQTLDVSGLTEGLHALHYQVTENTGAVAFVRSALFVNVKSLTTTQAAGLRYWFDDDASSVRTTDGVSSAYSLDVSTLVDGLHTLHYQVIDSNGGAYTIASSLFVKMTDAIDAGALTTSRLIYWYDDETNLKGMDVTGSVQTLDASTLTDGLHTIHVQVVGSDNAAYHIVSALFVKKDNSSETTLTANKLLYWFDNEQNTEEKEITEGVQVVDVSHLPEGLHTIHYQVLCNNDVHCPPCSSLFVKMDAKVMPNVKAIRYWFDENHASTKQEDFSEVKIIDASNLSEGTHSLYYQLVGDDGQLYSVTSGSFERYYYDIYISKSTEYEDSIVSSDPLFAQEPSLKLHYVTDDTNVRGHLTVDEGTILSLGNYIQTANWGSINDGSKYTKAGTEYYHPTTLLNNGFVRSDSVTVKQKLYRDRWHFISLPFTTNVSDIDVPDGTYWALRSYDGEARATGLMNETWRNMHSGDQMEAGRGYIIQLTKEGNDKTSELTFKAVNDTHKNDIFTTSDVNRALEEHQSEFPHNRSWNLTGNPYPSFYDTRYIAQSGNIIVWNGNGYSAYSLTDDNYILMPFEAFFIQKPLNVDAITFSKEGRQHTYEVLPRAEARRASNDNRSSLNFILTDGIDSDRSRVVINEQALMGYEADKDAPKFMETQPQIPQLFSVEGGVQYAINERPQGDGLITFSLYVPTDGEYRFAVVGDAADMTVFDSETKTVWALADGDYVFTAMEGQHDARLIVSFNSEATAIAQVNAYNDGEVKVTDGQLSFSFMRNKHIKVFGLDGRMMFNDAVSQGCVKVASGVYVLDIDGKTTKIMVK